MNIMKTDNILLRVRMTFEQLCGTTSGPIKPEQQPLLAAVEPVRERGAAADTPAKAFRYVLVFPGNGFARVAFKVAETSPSITQDQLTARGGMVRVQVEGYEMGVIEGDRGGAVAYFKATSIKPAELSK